VLPHSATATAPSVICPTPSCVNTAKEHSIKQQLQFTAAPASKTQQQRLENIKKKNIIAKASNHMYTHTRAEPCSKSQIKLRNYIRQKDK
jgi:hypothetical protein